MKPSTKQLKSYLMDLKRKLIADNKHKAALSDPLEFDSLEQVIQHYSPTQILMWIRTGYRQYVKRKKSKNTLGNKHSDANKALSNASPSQLAEIKRKLGIKR